MLTVSVLLAAAVSAAYYKTIPGNLIKGGDFNSADVADYFWMNPDEVLTAAEPAYGRRTAVPATPDVSE